MVFAITMDSLGKNGFIEACGGPTAPIGNNGVTAQEFADTLEKLIDHLTSPGSRVYPATHNTAKFWDDLTNSVDP